jgi:hypothetical protein
MVDSTLVTVRPMPVEQSIHWKPLRDPHYVLASLQPADGGRRTIVIRQSVLIDVMAAARGAHGKRVTGLLLGGLHRCPITGLDFQLIEFLAEHPHPVTDDLTTAIDRMLGATTRDRHHQILGWYASVPVVETRIDRAASAVHAAYFREPWHTTLVLSELSGISAGAFFLHDAVALRWFCAPFYEQLDQTSAVHNAKPTCVSWPQYMTSDEVVLIGRERPSAPPAPHDAEVAAVPRPPEHDSIAPVRAVPDEKRPPGQLSRRLATPPPPVASTSDAPPGPERRPDIAGLRPTRDAEPGPALDLHRAIPVERAADVPARTPTDAPIIDDRRSHPRSHETSRRGRESEDTTPTDDPKRFIDLAAIEGFAIIATFTSDTASGTPETLWVLADSSAGILLTVATTSRRVLDATMHYNVHAEEAELLNTPFPEHRDLASGTMYVRDTCLSQLRAKCRALRESMTLEREWKVSPTIYLVTPREWRFVAPDPRKDVSRIKALTNERISALPAHVRQQFDLGIPPRQTG